ncbi:MAG: hypothetical protein J7J99_07345 [Thermoprotei archaeon]|nr:hypothetical protein [Thermoprotei archaeon]
MKSRKLSLVREIVRRMGYVSINSLRRWLNLSSVNDARKLVYRLTRIDENLEPVYTVTFEKEGPLASFSVEEVEESRLREVLSRKIRDGWKLKSKYISGIKFRGFSLMFVF